MPGTAQYRELSVLSRVIAKRDALNTAAPARALRRKEESLLRNKQPEVGQSYVRIIATVKERMCAKVRPICHFVKLTTGLLGCSAQTQRHSATKERILLATPMAPGDRK